MRLRILLAVAVVSSVVLVVSILPAPGRRPPPGSLDSELEAMHSELQQWTERLTPLPDEVVLAQELLRDAGSELAEDPIGFVTRRLGSESSIERSAGLLAVQELVQAKGPGALRPLLPAIRRHRDDRDPWVRVLVVRALVALRSLEPEAVHVEFRQMLADPEAAVVLAACAAISECAALERLAGADGKHLELEQPLLDIARHGTGDAQLQRAALAAAGSIGGRRAADVIFGRLQRAEDDPQSRKTLLESLGLCARGHAAALQLLQREAFTPVGNRKVVSGARTGFRRMATDEVLRSLPETSVEVLLDDAAGGESSALLLARIARARGDSELARIAVARLGLSLQLRLDCPGTLEIVREMQTLSGLTELPNDGIRSAVDRLLEDPKGCVARECGEALRRLRHELQK